jgi:predicted acylesterase/phospholipase RssA
MDQIFQNPFDNIALALSGGGFRAASYGLGTMSYLHAVGWQDKSLLEHVSFISSTSGGSITLAFYTSRLYQGQEIGRILHDLYCALQGDKLIQAAIERLTNDLVWQSYPHKQRNLINALAITYDRDLYQGITLKSFWETPQTPHVQEVSINSTELNNGTSFRFKLSQRGTRPRNFGNSYLHFKDNALWAIESLRIGDIVAASSCFPLGFEPLIFPSDFAAGPYEPAKLLAAMEMSHNNPVGEAEVVGQPFGLIDGGVVDNQGIYSLDLEAESRDALASKQAATDKRQVAASDRPFSLLIIADVASYFMMPYKVPRTLGGLWKRIPLLAALPATLLAALMPFLATILFAMESAPWYNYVLLLPGFVLTALITWTISSLVRVVRAPEQPTVAKVLRRHIFKILWQPLGWWWKAIQTRGISFSMLAQDVFLKQIRRMHQRQAYDDPRNAHRLLSNFIYDLSLAQARRRELDAPKKDGAWWTQYEERLRPSQALQDMAEAARNIGTTLWFDTDRPQDLEHVVATGQFTTCFNLIRHLNRIEAASGQPLSPALETMRQQLLADWARFQAQPDWMLDRVRTAPSISR